ncbi:hypothetical protein KIN20_038232 [Parelaphostrongylus tenuis]|uniref:Uncharacterized protein n=1 Tax=Parelaphostrongylus tenuis TaxID=148309 RepID=A0AAD5REW7_PARTN|nr:hypothetical protein KIN20_038232 [Parelaphostrongylus tenuis]
MAAGASVTPSSENHLQPREEFHNSYNEQARSTRNWSSSRTSTLADDKTVVNVSTVKYGRRWRTGASTLSSIGDQYSTVETLTTVLASSLHKRRWIMLQTSKLTLQFFRLTRGKLFRE